MAIWRVLRTIEGQIGALPPDDAREELAKGGVEIGPPFVVLDGTDIDWHTGPTYRIAYPDGRIYACTVDSWYHWHKPVGAIILGGERGESPPTKLFVVAGGDNVTVGGNQAVLGV